MCSLQYNCLYSMCKEVEYIPPQAHTVSQLSSGWIMHCGSTLLLLRLLLRQKKVRGKCSVYHICSDSCCVTTWLLCFSVHKLRPFIKLVMMGLGLCCQPGKWSVTEAVSEPRTFSCCNKSRFMTSFWYIFWLEMKTFYERWIFKCIIWRKIEKNDIIFLYLFTQGDFICFH